MKISPEQVKELRSKTGVGMMEAKKALTEAAGDEVKAIEVLRKAGQKLTQKKAGRQAGEGVVGVYEHANQKVAAMVVLNCETDFVARTDDFKNLAHDIAMHIAAAQPDYIKPEDVPNEILAKEKNIAEESSEIKGKPEKVVEKIVKGKLEKFYSEVCLMRQPFIKDDAMTIAQLVEKAIAKLGENIQIREFTYLVI
ncbi:MAG: translation elongation factor Ts [Patescibacteria group bacterium]